MKANELRIGNYINADENNYLSRADAAYFESIVPYKIDGLSDFIYVIHLAENGSAVMNIEDIKPIPLTEQWLLDFGFIEDYQGVHSDWRKEIKSISVLIIHDGNGFHSIVGEFGTWIEVKHVHQLQNLYHSLTGTELTLNN